MKTARDVAATSTSEDMIRRLRKALDMLEEDTNDPLAEGIASIIRDNAAILLECIRNEHNEEVARTKAGDFWFTPRSELTP